MPTANTLQSSTEPDRVAVVKPYFVSPQEWKVGVLILAFVACLRVVFLWNGFSSPPKVPWTDSFQFDKTKEDMLSRLNRYCRPDANLFCREYFPTTCLHSYNNLDPSLMFIWGDHCMKTTFERLTGNKWWNITRYEAEINNELSKKSIGENNSINKMMTDPETKQILHLFVYTIAALFKRINFGAVFEGSSLEMNRLIRHYFIAILDMFEKNSKTTTMTTNDVIKQVWTNGELFILMRFAIKFVQDPEVKAMILERPKPEMYLELEFKNLEPNYHQFITRVIQVETQLEEKYGNGSHPVGVRLTTHNHTQELIATHQQQQQPALFRPDDKNTCMYKHYYATDNDDDDGGDGLIMQRCQVGMKEAVEVFPYLPTELEYDLCEGTFDFAASSLFYSFIIMMLALWRLLHCKESHKSSADKRRRQLQQELEDPHLRSVLERKFPVDKREEAIAKVEEMVANWDSKATAVRLVRLQVQRFRKFILAETVGWIFGVYWMRQCYPECAFGLYLDNIFVTVLGFVASYSIPMNLVEEETPNDVGAVEMPDCQPLLGEENPSYSSTLMTTA